MTVKSHKIAIEIPKFLCYDNGNMVEFSADKSRNK